MNTKKVLTNALKGIVEGSKYYIKLVDANMEPKFIDDITDYFTDIIFNLEPLDSDDLYDTISDCTYDLAKNGVAKFYIDTGLDEERWITIEIKSVEELADKMMECYFPHKLDEKR